MVAYLFIFRQTTIDKMTASMKEIIRVLLLKDPDYGKKIIADFHPLAL